MRKQRAIAAMGHRTSILNLPRSELLALALLVLLAVLGALFPWSRLTPDRVPGPSKDYPFANLRFNKPPAPRPGPSMWRMTANYRPHSTTLQVTINHKYNAPTGGFTIVAEFSPDGVRPPVLGVWLREQAGGDYRSDDVKLDKGEWFMSVSGRRHSEPVFRLEQILNIE